MLRPGALLVTVFLSWLTVAAQAPAGLLTIAGVSPPKGVLRQAYFFELKASGGTRPLHWQVTEGSLPPGLTLDASSGRIAGAPAAVGEFRFTVSVRDKEQPPQTATRDLVLHVVAPLTVEWKLYPQVEGNNAIRGAVVVSNGTDDACDLTFVAVAVNEIGKAFALGYQHFTLARESASPQLDFGASVPAGKYVVHVDAVAEVPSRDAIYRARLQSSPPLALTGLP